jgi:hypothetical protein
MARIRREFLLKRARNRCEYCHTPESRLSLVLQIEHIVARQHGGSDAESNLAMACAHCNQLKGPNVASIDALTGNLIRLFNPRMDQWNDHFRLGRDSKLSGGTDVGRVTIALLGLNDALMMRKRRALRRLGVSFRD